MTDDYVLVPFGWHVMQRDGSPAINGFTYESSPDSIAKADADWPANAPHSAMQLFTAAPAPQPAPEIFPGTRDAIGRLTVRGDDNELPPLPEPQRECWLGHQLYTADQMRAYARASIAALQRPIRPVSNEDVELACRRYYNSGNPVYPPVFEAMRAALESFRESLVTDSTRSWRMSNG